jgi:putative flippase GtrA
VPPSSPHSDTVERVTRLAGSKAARPVRFGIVGAITFGLHILLLTLLINAGFDAFVANALALAISVQFNFAVSQLLVWHDRHGADAPLRLGQRWFTFHAAIGLSLVIQVVAFALAQPFMPPIAAAIVGVAASTVIKFLSLDRLVFRSTGLR